jgi:hypothetical protein
MVDKQLVILLYRYGLRNLSTFTAHNRLIKPQMTLF